MFFPMCSFLRDQFYGDTALPIVWSFVVVASYVNQPMWMFVHLSEIFFVCVCDCVCVCMLVCIHAHTCLAISHWVTPSRCGSNVCCFNKLMQKFGLDDDCQSGWLPDRMTVSHDDCQTGWMSGLYVYLLVLVLENQNFEKKIQHSIITTVHACLGDVLVGLHIYHHFLFFFSRCKSFVPLF